MLRAAFLDRDGVLNRPISRNGSAGSPRSLEEFELVDSAAQCVGKLHAAEFLVIVVTNQPDLARGILDPKELDRMHNLLKETTSLDAIYTCPHDDMDACTCRKPKPGLLLLAAKEWGIALDESYMVGDSWKDIEAGNAAGCKTFLIESTWNPKSRIRSTYHVRDLKVATEMIVLGSRPAEKRTCANKSIFQ